MDDRGRPQLPRRLFLGAAIASIGGPLALVALYVPGAAGGAVRASGLTAAIAIVVFFAPLAVWLAYSERVVSAGGLAAFVEAAVGRRAAQAQALVWIVSYFLYLPYTVTYIVYDVLPAVFPGLSAYRASLELAVPAGIVVLVLAPPVVAFGALAFAAAAQLVLAVVLGAVVLAHAGGHSSSFTSPPAAETTMRGAGGIALLFVCVSLPLFFGAEVRGGAGSVRNGLLVAYAAAAAVLLFAAIPLAAVPASLRNADLPGVAMAQAYGGRGLAVAIGLGTAASVCALIVLEFLALGRLLHWLFAIPVRVGLAAIAVPFVVADAISLVNPERFYSELLRPSLIALWVSQLIVFAVFPLYRLRSRTRLVPAAVALAAVACGLAGYGLYTAIINSVGT
jgi:hypothetical protein